MKVLLITSETWEEVEQTIFSFESTRGAVVDQVQTFKEAARALKSTRPNLVIAVCPTVSIQDHEAFGTALRGIPFAVTQGKKDTRDWQGGGVFTALLRPSTLVADALRVYDQTEKQSDGQSGAASPESEEAFCRIRTTLLLTVGPLKGDIFIRLSDSHFVKLFNEGDHFDKADLKRITEKKKVDYLFLKRNSAKEFVEKYCAKVETQLSSSKFGTDLKQSISVNESVYETIQSMAQDLGLAKDVQLLAKTQMRVALRAVGKTPRLKTYLEKLGQFQGEYLATHSLATGYLACAISANLEWGSDATFQKLTLAALMHDVTLKSSSLAQIMTKADLENAELSAQDRMIVNTHANKAADLVRGFSEMPPDVDAIIVQHHEFPDGTGFPRGLRHTYISPLASIFGIAHEIADQAVRQGRNYDAAAHLKLLQSKYDGFSTYRKIMVAIGEVMRTPIKEAA